MMEQDRTDNRLLEPLEAYKRFYRAEFEKNASDFFDKLVERSGISLEENRRTVAAYDAKMRQVNDLERRLSKNRTARGFLIALIVLGGIALLFAVAVLVYGNYLTGGIALPLGGAAVAVGFGVIFGKINPLLKRMGEEKAKRQAEAEKLQAEAWEQMKPLNDLFDDSATKQLIEQTVPPIQLDDNFNMRRYEYLHTKYGFGEPDDPERSTVGILTGEIAGNPFVVDRELVHRMGMCTYTGTLLITWTTTSTDSEGHTHIEHHSETLVATIDRPKPYYSTETRLIYGNEAAPDLHFSRVPSHAERLSENAREKKVRKGVKKIRKRQEREMKDDDPTTNFTEMGNGEFDVLFGALDRDNEVQFRLLYTPLAQKNILALLTDTAGFGDDFRMRKDGCLNFISSEHSASWDLEAGYKRYRSYSADLSKEIFLAFNGSYFKNLYFDLAPLLSVPLYQQHKPQEYFYPEKYPRNFTAHESEYLANRVGQEAFCHPETNTPTILKTKFLKEEGKSDRIGVTAYSYRTEQRVEYVPEFGGDGCYHDVPVYWTEYIPVVNRGSAALKEFGLSEKAFDDGAEGNKLRAALAKCGAISFGYGHGILCCKVSDEETPFDGAFPDLKE